MGIPDPESKIGIIQDPAPLTPGTRLPPELDIIPRPVPVIEIYLRKLVVDKILNVNALTNILIGKGVAEVVRIEGHDRTRHCHASRASLRSPLTGRYHLGICQNDWQ